MQAARHLSILVMSSTTVEVAEVPLSAILPTLSSRHWATVRVWFIRDFNEKAALVVGHAL